jgi:ribosomal protein S18 acetylase RimI-like enzyme
MKNKIIIREMIKQDIPQVAGLIEQLDEIFTSGHNITKQVIESTFIKMNEYKNIYNNYVAVLDDKVVGLMSTVVYKTFFHPGGTMLINELVVDKNFRGRGIGELFINKIKQLSKEKKLNEVEVSTSFENKKAIDFYKKKGFTDESILLGMELCK